jgi:hypothetical protein
MKKLASSISKILIEEHGTGDFLETSRSFVVSIIWMRVRV